MENRSHLRQMLNICLEVIDNPEPGEPIAKFHAFYSGCKEDQVYGVYAEELEFVPSAAAVAESVLHKFDDDDAYVFYDSSCHFLCDGTKCIVPRGFYEKCPNSTENNDELSNAV